jgi:molybdopterin converting factor small subunit
MVRVKVEFWTRSGSGKELGPDFEHLHLQAQVQVFPADKRAALSLCMADGTTVRALFEDLERYPMVKSEIFSDHAFHPDITLTLNSLVMGYDELYDRVLTNGDTIAVLPMYVGG